MLRIVREIIKCISGHVSRIIDYLILSSAQYNICLIYRMEYIPPDQLNLSQQNEEIQACIRTLSILRTPSKGTTLNELLSMGVGVQPITAILVEKLCDEVKKSGNVT